MPRKRFIWKKLNESIGWTYKWNYVPLLKEIIEVNEWNEITILQYYINKSKSDEIDKLYKVFN